MRRFRTSFLALLLIAIPVIGISQAGTLDNSFNSDGIALFDFTGYHETAWDLRCMTDTSIMLVGTTNQSAWFENDGYIMKVLPDGTQDMSWGTNGLVLMEFGEDTFPYNMEILADGSILVGGTLYVTVSDAEFFLAKFHPDGTLNTGFGVNGIFTSSYHTGEDVCEDFTLQPDGKIVMAGRTYQGSFSQMLFLRVNSDGTLDTGFGTNGYTEINASIQDERVNSVEVLSSGAIVGLGYGYQSSPWFGEQIMMAKLNPDGSPMTSFSTNGVIIPSFVTDISVAFATEQRNDSIFVTGYHYDAANNQELFLTKLDSSGLADSAFGINGITLLQINPVNTGQNIHLTDDQKIYVAGTTGLGGMNNRDFMVVRYLPDGSLDASFDSDGYVVTDIRPDWDEAYGLDIQIDGKIVCGGMSGGLSSSGNNDIPVTRYLNDYLPSGIYANFTSSTQLGCINTAIDYTDLSVSTDGTISSWEWSFEGGTPSTSSAQNPTVQYSTAGTYDVQLIVYDGLDYDTLLREDYITLESPPVAPGTPSGPVDVCNTYDYDYITNSVEYATSYYWTVEPTDAGTMIGSDTASVFESSLTWSGTAQIKVRGTGMCGDGNYSTPISVEVRDNPEPYQLLGDGPFCSGSSGSIIYMEDSEVGVDYELFLDQVSTGIIMSGTGDSLIFGTFTDEGLYSATGFTSYCVENMVGELYVYEEFPPVQPVTPMGETEACNNDSSAYYTDPIVEATYYLWILNPADAGDMEVSNNTVDIIWNPEFSGTVFISVQAENECGFGEVSDSLEISVIMSPNPEIIGEASACANEEEIYSTEETTGNVYVWECEGGEIISGNGTSEITVLWGEPGSGKLVVTEQSSQNCFGDSEEFEVVIDECTNIEELLKSGVRIYPNPVDDMLTINLPKVDISEIIEIRIVNAVGLVKTHFTSNNNKLITIETVSFENGIYFVQLTTENNIIVSKKFIVNR